MLNVLKSIGRPIFLGLAWIAATPFLIVGFLMPRSAWKPLIRLGFVLLFYRYVYPKRLPFDDLGRVYQFIFGLVLNLYGSRQIAEKLFTDHRELVGMGGTALAFLYKFAKDRQKEKKTLKEKTEKQLPNVTVDFILDDDGSSTCTILNIGPGTAMAVKFRFYVWDDLHSDDEADSGSIKVRARTNIFLRNETKRFWRLRERRSFPFILPSARQPKAVPLGIVPTEPSVEIRVELEFRDISDRRYLYTADGGQSRDHSFMSVANWEKIIVEPGPYKHSKMSDLGDAVKFYLGKLLQSRQSE